MNRLGPYEAAPHLAVGCSGGADSLALTLLLGHWVEKQGGRLTALIVDHGIREEAAAEAREVQGWLETFGIASEILEAKLTADISSLQASARTARYELMGDWCRVHGVLHLFIAHHQEDQAETLLLNLTRGSGVDGLAGMAAISERGDYRLLRPMLTVPKARLEATLSARNQTFIDDPSNSDRAFKRVRLRKVLPHLAEEGASANRLSKAARRMAEARAALETATTSLLATGAALYPEGYGRLEIPPLLSAPREVALRALARLIRTIGGKSHTPRGERLVACYEALSASERKTGPFGRTLGGCRLLKRGSVLFICREVATSDIIEARGNNYLWDGRFSVSGPADKIASLVPLGSGTFPGFADYKRSRIPAPFRSALPTMPGLDGTPSLPQLKGVALSPSAMAETVLTAVFQPRRPLSEGPFSAAVEADGRGE
ncbi:MAG TPA: tRNA lysidine(34) synthetase TilS [Rhodospirillaceae bacterium]|nr:tRNA lysidine(34) synthetase TilS [Rhodospirillaceae bacterium]HAT36551.1 tRNA lysidine(34) synthetase TilS [Rhodospirillaceae bacterium]